VDDVRYGRRGADAAAPRLGASSTEVSAGIRIDAMTTEQILILAGVIVVLALAGLVALIVHKGRPFATGDVFRASRLSRGNHLFPTQVMVSPTSVVHYTPQWVGKLEHTIHMAHVASVRIDTHLIFSDVFIETSGGVSDIKCYGHHKRDAVRIKELIEKHQSDYFQTPGRPAGTVARPTTGR
jgi:hypothetical protein